MNHQSALKLRTTSWLSFLTLVFLMFEFVSLADAHRGKGVNGGQLFDTGQNHVELVGASGYELLIIAVTDEAQRPISIAGIKAYLLVERNGQQRRIPLDNQGGNILSSRDNPNLVAGEVVQFVANIPDGTILNAEFISK